MIKTNWDMNVCVDAYGTKLKAGDKILLLSACYEPKDHDEKKPAFHAEILDVIKDKNPIVELEIVVPGESNLVKKTCDKYVIQDLKVKKQVVDKDGKTVIKTEIIPAEKRMKELKDYPMESLAPFDLKIKDVISKTTYVVNASHVQKA